MYESWVSGCGRTRGRHQDAYCAPRETAACRGGRDTYSRLMHVQGEQKQCVIMNTENSSKQRGDKGRGSREDTD